MRTRERETGRREMVTLDGPGTAIWGISRTRGGFSARCLLSANISMSDPPRDLL